MEMNINYSIFILAFKNILILARYPNEFPVSPVL
jgi:hypothetical protein